MSDEVEHELRELFDAGDLDATLSRAIEHYGNELFGFVIGLARDRAVAEDAFSAACERMWKGLAKFRWDSTLRVWAYAIARNEFLRGTKATTRAKREVPLSQVRSVQQMIDRVKSATPVYEKSSIKDRFADVRATLDPDDHVLLGLRLDREMAWTDIAKVLGDDNPSTREVAALRKRYERLKTRLRAAIKAN